MADGTWTSGSLCSHKHGQEIEVEYQCEPELNPQKFTIWIRPRERWPEDPPDEIGYQATFIKEDGGTIRATSLSRNGFESLKGVTHDLLMRVAGHAERAVRSSLLLDHSETAEDRDDQLQEEGKDMWERFKREGRAVFDNGQRRYHLTVFETVSEPSRVASKPPCKKD